MCGVLFRGIYGDKVVVKFKGLGIRYMTFLMEYQDEYYVSSTSNILGEHCTVVDHPIPPTTLSKSTLWGEVNQTQKKKTTVRIELDYYLDDDSYPDKPGFDVICFWKLDAKYLTLKRLVRLS